MIFYSDDVSHCNTFRAQDGNFSYQLCNCAHIFTSAVEERLLSQSWSLELFYFKLLVVVENLCYSIEICNSIMTDLDVTRANHVIDIELLTTK